MASNGAWSPAYSIILLSLSSQFYHIYCFPNGKSIVHPYILLAGVLHGSSVLKNNIIISINSQGPDRDGQNTQGKEGWW